MISFRHTLSLAVILLLQACTVLSQGQSTQIETRIQQLRTEVADMKSEFERTRETLQARSAETEQGDGMLAARLDTVQATLETLPSRIDVKCPAPAPIETKPVCKEPPAPKAEATLGKSVVGEKERIRLDPPGKIFMARMDTGATSSSLHAQNIVQFERDGANWVRFDLQAEEGIEKIEAPIMRYARVVQQADPKGSRRPVVSLRLQLGEIEESVEFTLADRSHLETEVLLGRSFLTDLAIVDVSRKFIQPSPKK